MEKTLRDEFAMAAPFTLDDATREIGATNQPLSKKIKKLINMQLCYADAMMEARKTKPE